MVDEESEEDENMIQGILDGTVRSVTYKGVEIDVSDLIDTSIKASKISNPNIKEDVNETNSEISGYKDAISAMIDAIKNGVGVSPIGANNGDDDDDDNPLAPLPIIPDIQDDNGNDNNSSSDSDDEDGNGKSSANNNKNKNKNSNNKSKNNDSDKNYDSDIDKSDKPSDNGKDDSDEADDLNSTENDSRSSDDSDDGSDSNQGSGNDDESSNSSDNSDADDESNQSDTSTSSSSYEDSEDISDELSKRIKEIESDRDAVDRRNKIEKLKNAMSIAGDEAAEKKARNNSVGQNSVDEVLSNIEYDIRSLVAAENKDRRLKNRSYGRYSVKNGFTGTLNKATTYAYDKKVSIPKFYMYSDVSGSFTEKLASGTTRLEIGNKLILGLKDLVEAKEAAITHKFFASYVGAEFNGKRGELGFGTEVKEAIGDALQEIEDDEKANVIIVTDSDCNGEIYNKVIPGVVIWIFIDGKINNPEQLLYGEKGNWKYYINTKN